MTMLRNRHIDLYRSAARAGTSSPLHELRGAGRPAPGLRPDEVAEQQEVFAAVHALESPFRETVVAVDVLGLSYKEAAKALDVPVGTVMSRLARGRERVVRARAVAPAPEARRSARRGSRAAPG